MKTLPLRTLLREPLRVKKMTRAGMSVQITDNGAPLWVLTPAESKEPDQKEDRELDAFFDEVLRDKPSKISLSKIILDSRR
jgi:hypothetical protein